VAGLCSPRQVYYSILTVRTRGEGLDLRRRWNEERVALPVAISEKIEFLSDFHFYFSSMIPKKEDKKKSSFFLESWKRRTYLFVIVRDLQPSAKTSNLTECALHFSFFTSSRS
jgi:hypothetical protein